VGFGVFEKSQAPIKDEDITWSGRGQRAGGVLEEARGDKMFAITGLYKKLLFVQEEKRSRNADF